MRARFASLLPWNRNTAFLALLVIVVAGLVSCAGGTGAPGSGGTGPGNAALNAASSTAATNGGTSGGTSGSSGSGGSSGSTSGGSGSSSGSGGSGSSGSGSTGGSGSGSAGSGSGGTGSGGSGSGSGGSGSGSGGSGSGGTGGTGGTGGGTGGSGSGTAGASLPATSDPSGMVQTFTTDPSGKIDTTGAFFQSLGTNGRTCATCHVQGDGWSISAADVQTRFAQAQASAGGLSSDPIFQSVDGATCNHDVDVTTPAGQAKAFSLLTGRGLIRVGLAVPSNAEFTVASVVSPYPCSETAVLSMYRRPLPTANLRFLSMLMWDGRESSALTATQDITKATNPADLLTDLAHQSVDATLIHAQGQVATPLTTAQQQAIVNAEMALFVAQTSDTVAGSLQADGTTGGPAALSAQTFSIGVNDPFSSGFNFSVFTLFKNWLNSTTALKASIARGETIFSTRSLNVTGVAGFNDTFFGGGPAAEPCGYCHDSPNVGNHSLAVPMNIGVANLTNQLTNPLDVSYLPVITLKNIATGATVQTTDPGRALVTGKWADVGKVKVPALRGLASRAPYFHNGAALTLSDVVNFYDERFGIGFTPQDKADLVAFLSTL